MLTVFSFLLCGCNGQSNSQNKYLKSKSEFNDSLTEHFPNELATYPREIIKDKNISKNNFCFILYEYKANLNKVDSVLNSIRDISIGKYSSKDPCLLIVNRFETIDTYENRKVVEITDSLKVNRDCYKNFYPTPNFINYNSSSKSNGFLDKEFELYVLGAKSGNFWKEYNLKPNPQMPIEWANGYSKGVAVSLDKKTLIYWFIVW
ncbi:hypothetical protein [Flavobacterium subsaxonicum]|uniref:hypothetical protein n=1 Tax=Flavobacterium subsaxonicum TaxID=426226 RepID=UPI0013772F6D|nr:hypothetical protein [Flavobacterium subsaxonicum]